MIEVYPKVSPKKLKRIIEGMRLLYLRWWKKKVIQGMFMWLEYKYGGFKSTNEGSTLGGVWTTGRRREPTSGGKGKLTKL